ncbi:class I SAM-dependent methyltransferase [Amaricoccus sp. W119]|uniref:class I SAM-dependent methyltransferase n=1 Tax=Amaricoccus sp. W119 TaxID=3391833 RepID=UPI0039A5B0D6
MAADGAGTRTGGTRKGYYESGAYWRKRTDLMYYQYFKYFVRCLAPNAKSLIDIGSGNAPYLEWFDWIPDRVSFDKAHPYQSETVRGLEGDFFTFDFGQRFDLVTCMQVLEHIPDAERFARRLTEIGDLLLVSVPFRWPKGQTRGHVNDPVDLKKLSRWFGREPNYSMIVREPFVKRAGARLFAIYDPDPERVFNAKIRHTARPLAD